MQVAILVVLIVIAVILAPWLLGLIAAGVAAFGVLLVAAFGVAIAISLGVAIWLVAKEITKRKGEPPPIKGVRKVCASCQAEMPVSSVRCPSCGASN